MELDETDRRILNALQGDFPICPRPYRVAAERLGLSERKLVARLKKMLKERLLTRFGPLYNADRMDGINVLAAMVVPEDDYANVATLVNAQPEIAHNYRREHWLNMWFVGAGETPDAVEAAFRRIEEATGVAVYRFPKEREYFVELKLKL